MIPILEVASQLVSEPIQCWLVALVLVVRPQQLRQLMARTPATTEKEYVLVVFETLSRLIFYSKQFYVSKSHVV